MGIPYEYCISIASNIPSTSLGKKSIIKIEAPFHPTDKFHMLGLMKSKRPVTVSTIFGGKVVFKEDVNPPEYFEGLVRCSHPRCITNSDKIYLDSNPEPVMPTFDAVKPGDLNSGYECHYCGTYLEGDIITKALEDIRNADARELAKRGITTSYMPPWIQSANISPYALKGIRKGLELSYRMLMDSNHKADQPITLCNGQKVILFKKGKHVFLTRTDSVLRGFKNYTKLKSQSDDE